MRKDVQEQIEVMECRTTHNPASEPYVVYLKQGSTLPTDAEARKKIPLVRGLLDYFPNALAEVAMLSLKASEQHGHGDDMHWEFDLSNDHADCLLRHLVERGTYDTDNVAHSTKVAWRALAMREVELIKAGAKPGRAVRFGKRED